MLPLIGITTDLSVPDGKEQPFCVVDSGYFDGVLAAGGSPVLIPPIAKEEVIEELVDRFEKR